MIKLLKAGLFESANEFKNVEIYNDEANESAIIVSIEYGVKIGNKTEITTVAVKL